MTTSPPQGPGNGIKPVLVPLVALILTLGLAFVYFGERTIAQPLRDAGHHFYSRFSPGWFRFSEGELHDATLSGRPSDMDQLVVRAALSRWRLREQSPIPFDNIMTWYGEGLWNSPDREAWEQVFEELDAQWLGSRREHDTEATAHPEPSAGALILHFPTSPPASTLGSRLTLFMEIDGGEGVAAEPDFVAYWQTTASPGRSAFRARRGEVHLLDKSEAGQRRFKVVFDLSWEPAWLAPGATVTMIEIFSAALGDDGPARIRFDDSPLLPSVKIDVDPGNGD